MDGLIVRPIDRQAKAPIHDLLRTFGFEDPNTLSSLAARLPMTPDEDDPTGAAQTAIGEWFVPLLNQDEISADEAFRLGRAAFVTQGCASRWPMALLADELPQGFADRLRQGLPIGCPPDMPTAMVVQSLSSPAPLSSIVAWFRRWVRHARPA
jgi:hypothetical protein